LVQQVQIVQDHARDAQQGESDQGEDGEAADAVVVHADEPLLRPLRAASARGRGRGTFGGDIESRKGATCRSSPTPRSSPNSRAAAPSGPSPCPSASWTPT